MFNTEKRYRNKIVIIIGRALVVVMGSLVAVVVVVVVVVVVMVIMMVILLVVVVMVVVMVVEEEGEDMVAVAQFLLLRSIQSSVNGHSPGEVSGCVNISLIAPQRLSHSVFRDKQQQHQERREG